MWIWLLCLGIVGAPSAGLAFTVQSVVTSGCHESMTRSALSAAGWPGDAAPPALSELERRMIRDLPFGEVEDPFTLALLIGARHPDLHGLRETDLVGLAEAHGDPEHQATHCLRAPEHDGVEGDLAALSACRSALLAQVAEALGPDEVLDQEARQEVSLALSIRGCVTAPLPRFAFQMGQALHGLQDSFSHTLRTADWVQVRTVFNHVDPLHRGYEPARDGAPHQNRLDACDGDGAPAAVEATLASIALLRAVADPQGGRAGRLARADALLARYLQHEPGCRPDNRWCGAAPSGCAAAGVAPGGAPLCWFALLLVGAATRRRRGLLLGLGLLLAGPAWAGAPRPEAPRLSLYTGAAASFTRGGMAAVIGLRVRASRRFTFGLDVEYNPWIVLTAPHTHPGLFNAYASVSYAWLDFHGLILRTGVQAGVTVLLADLVAADAGSAGVVVGVSLLGCSVPLRPRLYLDLDPAWLVLPLPQLRGLPLLYEQYRVAVGLRLGL